MCIFLPVIKNMIQNTMQLSHANVERVRLFITPNMMINERRFLLDVKSNVIYYRIAKNNIVFTGRFFCNVLFNLPICD